jgi:hypothetical protein
MSTKRFLLFAILGIALGGALVYKSRSQGVASGGQLSPFTAHTIVSLTDSKGVNTTYQIVTAVRSDGGHVQQNVTGAPTTLSINTRISDPVSRTITKWNSITRLKSTLVLSDNALASLRWKYQSTTCADRFGVGPEDPHFMGWDKVAGTQVAVYGREDQVAIWKYYIAPGFNCFQMKQTEDWKDHGGGKTVSEATQIVSGEPNASLFQVPSDAVEATPSAYEHEMTQAHFPGQPMPSSMEQSMKRRDGGYYKSRDMALKLGIKLPELQRP